jgi:integrase/recombinase XerD
MRFLAWLEVHGYSPNTIICRCDALRMLLRWCQERGISRPQDLSSELLQRYQRHLYHQPLPGRDRPMSLNTQHNRLQGLRSFFRWLTRQHLLPFNPASEIELPRLGQRLPRHVLSPAEVESILSQPDLRTAAGLRDRAILETFYSTGMRRRELALLDLEDVDLERGLVRIRYGKGDKQRLVPLGSRAASWLDKYLQEVRPRLVQDPQERAVFVSLLGPALSPDWLSRRVSRYVGAAGLGPIGSCHLFRHSMATSMLDNGAELRFIQQMLGHEQLTSTQIYTHVAVAKLKQVHAATHPAELGRKSKAEQQGPSPQASSPHPESVRGAEPPA